jgi:hypothetical protein
MRPKLVALLVAAALTTGWLLASIVSPPVAKLQALPDNDQQPAPAPGPRATTSFTEQLHAKLKTPPAAPVPRRNPFVFGTSQRRTDARASDSVEPAAEAAAAPVMVATGPSLGLAGIASTRTAQGLVRTAIISDGTAVHLAKIGEAVAGYAVIEITDDRVVIANAAGAQWTLRLK